MVGAELQEKNLMWTHTEMILATYSAVAAHPGTGLAGKPQFELAMFLGFVTAFFTLLCFIERRSHAWVRFALVVFLLLDAGFGIAAGAWPLGMLQVVWAGYAFARWWSPNNETSPKKRSSQFQMRHRISEPYRFNALNN
jgi:hypothetical protein